MNEQAKSILSSLFSHLLGWGIGISFFLYTLGRNVYIEDVMFLIIFLSVLALVSIRFVKGYEVSLVEQGDQQVEVRTPTRAGKARAWFRNVMIYGVVVAIILTTIRYVL